MNVPFSQPNLSRYIQEGSDAAVSKVTFPDGTSQTTAAGDPVTGVSYSGDTLSLSRAEGSDLTTTIATSDPTKIENGDSSMEIASADGDCVFTPNGDADLTTTFGADGNISAGATVKIPDGEVTSTIDNLIPNIAAPATYTHFDRSLRFKRANGDYREYEIGILGDNTAAATNILAFGVHGGGTPDPNIMMGVTSGGNLEIAGDLYAVNVRASTTVYAAGSPLSSDDRIKENEKLIVNATETLSKLTPQIYDKYRTMDLSGSFFVESGLIAQEVYYNTPELRHLVYLGEELDTSGNEYTPTPEEMDLSGVDIANDPDYGSHGWSKTKHSWLNYQGLIPYLIKSNQEMAERLAALENK